MKAYDLNVGDMIVVVTRQDETPAYDATFFRGRAKPRAHEDIAGVPMRITGKSIPYITVRDENNGWNGVVDTREVTFTKPDRAYINQFRRMYDEHRKREAAEKRAGIAERAKRDPRECPRCGQRKSPGGDWE